jgi:beta-xylosidase
MSRLTRQHFLILFLIASLTACGHQTRHIDTAPWVSDLGNGYYQNPIIYADYSDPDVIRVGDEFYMTASSFNCTPGLPILHSRDLVNWQLINHAVKNLPDSHYGEVQAGCGIWAPAIRFHDGKFWITFATPDEGIFVTTAADPAGQCSPVGDPCPIVQSRRMTGPVPADCGHAWRRRSVLPAA